VFVAHAQHLSEAPVKVRANLHVRIGQSTLRGFEMIRKGQRYRVPGAIKHIDEQLAIARDMRPKATVKALEFGDKVQ